MKKLIEKTKKISLKSGLLNVAVLSSGALLVQVVNVFTQPLVTRIYSPQDLGILALIMSIITMFSSAMNGQYDLCIVSAKSDDEADKIAVGAFYIGLFLSTVVSFGIVILSIISPTTFGMAGNWIYTTIPLLYASSITNVVTNYNNRYEQYKLLAVVSVYRAVASNTIKLGLGYINAGVLGLVISSLTSIIIGIKKQSEYLLSRFDRLFHYEKKEIWDVLKRYKEQPLFSAPGVFVTSFSYSIIPFFISSLYGITEVGFFSLSMNMLGLPLTLISANVGRVFFRNASQERNYKGNFYGTFKSILLLLMILSIIPFSVLWIYAEPLFAIVFGDGWQRSGTFVKILIPMYWINFIVNALISGLIISKKQLLKLIIQCMFVFESIAIFIVTKQMDLSIELFLKLINATYIANYLVILFIIYRASKERDV